MDSIEQKLAYLRDEIDHRAIYRCPPKGRELPGKAPNTSYIWQFYLRRVMFDPKFIFTAAELLVDLMPDKDVQIAACEDAGVPLGLAIAAVLDSPMITVKKARKVYGLLNFTEGRFTGKPLVLVDDLAGSQTTLRNSQKILKAFGLEVAPFYVTLINKTKGTHDSYLSARLINLFTCDDFSMTWAEYVEKYKREPNFGAFF